MNVALPYYKWPCWKSLKASTLKIGVLYLAPYDTMVREKDVVCSRCNNA